MNRKQPGLSRRDVVKLSAASALAGVVLPQVHAGGGDTVKVALVGCGGRGTGAAENALNVESGQTQLVAMADVFRDRLDRSFNQLQRTHARKMDVPNDRKFIGFDAYQRAMDTLRPGDIAIFATPPAFRWVHFKYAIDKGLNVFMEKPVTVDGASTKKFLEQADRADRAGIKVGVGLMCRHCAVRSELFDRIQAGAIGDLVLLRAYRQHGPVGSCFVEPRPQNVPELEYQIRHFHGFLWASGGLYSDFYIHNIDECCWMKNDFPIKAKASGGRNYRHNFIDQNFDSYSVEYTFRDGAKMYLEGRTMQGCANEFATYVHGARGSAIVSTSGHSPARSKLFRSQNFSRENGNLIWEGPRNEPNPYQLEWEHLIHAIRNNTPYNEARRGAEASLVTAMGRLAAHTGREWTRDETLNLDFDLAPNVAELTLQSEAPIRAAADGKYPVPQPGIQTRREF